MDNIVVGSEVMLLMSINYDKKKMRRGTAMGTSRLGSATSGVVSERPPTSASRDLPAQPHHQVCHLVEFLVPPAVPQ